MNPLDFLNQNPAITSLVAFQLGLVLLLATAKYAGLGKIYTDTLGALKDHTAAEIKIEMKLAEVVAELKTSRRPNGVIGATLTINWTTLMNALIRLTKHCVKSSS